MTISPLDQTLALTIAENQCRPYGGPLKKNTKKISDN